LTRSDTVIVGIGASAGGLRALEAFVKTLRERLDLATTVARLTWWEWDVAAGQITGDEDEPAQSGVRPASVSLSLAEWEARVHPDDLPHLRSSYTECLVGAVDSWSCEVRVRAEDERFRWVLYGGRVIQRDARGVPSRILGTTQDIHARRTVETLVHRDAELLSKLQDAIFCTDPDGILTYWNDGAARLYGWGALEALGHPLTERVGRGAPGDVSGRFRAVLEGDDYRGEWEDVRKDGSRVWVDLWLTRVEDSEGRVTGLIGIARDVTERRRAEAERRQLELQLLHAQKMETIGTLAGGIAHDFNNILTAILMYSELCLLERPRATSLEEYLNEIKTASLRAKELVQRILTFSRFQEPDPKPIDVRDVVSDACKLLRAMLPATLDLDVTLPERPMNALADANQIHQVLLNLASNGAHAMQNTGELSLAVRELVVDTPLPVVGGVLSPRRYVSVTMLDRGHGMDASTRARIFDPFFTTKQPGEGTGLGLSIVQGILQSHGGGITVESAPGEGSVFTVYLPAAQAAAAEVTSVRPNGATPRGHGERILVVDDEESVALLTKTALDSLGYHASLVTNAEDFLRELETAPERYQLIVTDQTMPQLSGLDLARRVRATGNGVPILIATGFSRTLTPEAIDELGRAARLSKPFELQELAVLVHRLLERGAA